MKVEEPVQSSNQRVFILLGPFVAQMLIWKAEVWRFWKNREIKSFRPMFKTQYTIFFGETFEKIFKFQQVPIIYDGWLLEKIVERTKEQEI